MSKKANVIKAIHTEPSEAKLADAKAETQAEVVKPAEVAAKSIGKPSPYQVEYDDGYRTGSKDGATHAIHGFVATVEQKLAEHDGYEDPLKWRKEATIPAWWIAVLIKHLG